METSWKYEFITQRNGQTLGSIFRRMLQLPSGVKPKEVAATFDKGVLKVTLPKVAEAKEKIVKVKIK